MSESLGLSIGVANLVAARGGSVPVARTPVLTLFDHRQSEVGLPEENPNLNESGLVLRGFVERVGDPSPLVAADGTKYLGQALTIEALEAMARIVGYGTPLTIAFPAYWSENQVAALRQELFAQPDLAVKGGTPTLISDAAAALATLKARPGFPASGVVALCDFGAGGTSITLADAGSNFRQLGGTVRYSEFSGDDIDQLILNHLLTVSPGVDDTSVSNTATSMGSVTRMLGGCRAAKEQLSATTVATVSTGTPGGDRQLTRSEFEQLISTPLDRFIAAIGDVLQRNKIARLAAVGAAGGGASIPLITTRLSDALQVPVFTTPEPLFSAAVGAAALGQDQTSAGAATGMGPAVEVPTGIVGAVGPATVAAPAAPTGEPTSAVPTETFPDGARQSTDRALAWSEDTGTGGEPVPYTGPADYTSPGEPTPTPDYPAARPEPPPEVTDVPIWYRRPAILLSLAGAAAAILVAVVLALTMGHNTTTKPVVTTSQPPPITSDVVGPDNSHTTTVIYPPPVTVTTEVPVTTTTAEPTTTSTTSSISTTTSPTSTTTTQPTTTTTQPTTTQPTTTNPPTTTAPPTTTRPVPTRPTRPPLFPINPNAPGG
ncbi:Hsp70 family protein [Mycobacterium vicinigordonae]|uniref:Hsp70 family protein n=1 Tax=Mycobacterium vicinigordonae TaxID=1719132 RepID=A0A7D6HYQ5_9MYCO|nr:Hsp70 family protein [Mycobacterium vicinigordonae]QLL08035.1 Hsp70 family protein [Mycobacterium vicinigordonae]